MQARSCRDRTGEFFAAVEKLRSSSSINTNGRDSRAGAITPNSTSRPSSSTPTTAPSSVSSSLVDQYHEDDYSNLPLLPSARISSESLERGRNEKQHHPTSQFSQAAQLISKGVQTVKQKLSHLEKCMFFVVVAFFF
jgi:Syntaxin-5 N-terminal, Sly1p-binding domain